MACRLPASAPHGPLSPRLAHPAFSGTFLVCSLKSSGDGPSHRPGRDQESLRGPPSASPLSPLSHTGVSGGSHGCRPSGFAPPRPQPQPGRPCARLPNHVPPSLTCSRAGGRRSLLSHEFARESSLLLNPQRPPRPGPTCHPSRSAPACPLRVPRPLTVPPGTLAGRPALTEWWGVAGVHGSSHVNAPALPAVRPLFTERFASLLPAPTLPATFQMLIQLVPGTRPWFGLLGGGMAAV